MAATGKGVGETDVVRDFVARYLSSAMGCLLPSVTHCSSIGPFLRRPRVARISGIDASTIFATAMIFPTVYFTRYVQTSNACFGNARDNPFAILSGYR